LATIVLFIASVLITQSCKKDESDVPVPDQTPPTYTNGHGEISNIGGTIIIEDINSPLNGVFVRIPAGALSSSQYIEIVEAPSNILIPGDTTAILVEFKPKGLTFNKPIEIGIPYKKSESDTSKIKIFFYDADSSKLVQMPKKFVDIDNNLIVGYTNHFSYYTAIGKNGVIMKMEMLNVNGKVGVRVFIEGADGNVGLKWVPNTFFTQLNAEFNAWESLTNSLNEVYSSFHLILYKDKFLGKEPLSGKRIKIYRGNYASGLYKAQVYNSNPTQSLPIFTTEGLVNEDINSNPKSLGNWFCGKPLVFVFDDIIANSSDKYFVKATWALVSEPTGFAPWNYTPVYEFHNKKDKVTLGSMLTYNNDLDLNSVDDAYQVWNSNQKPVSDFTAVPTSTILGQPIQFSDLSTNNPTSWLWNFGDAGTSTLQNPSHTYSSAGTYTVSLTATNSFGSDIETKTNYINVSTAGSAPVAAFSANTTTPNTTQSVTFTDQSINNPTSWSWNFGDNSTSTQQNPSHTYSSAGTYTVSLTATNSFGSDIETKTNYIVVTTAGSAPVAEFLASTTTPNTTQAVTFTDQSTNNPTSWLWNFGGAGTSTLQNPSHVYSTTGTYTVSLTATNSYGSDTKIKTNYIIVTPILQSGEVYNPTTGKIWMDRNLGASQVATSSTDAAAYGDLYQWGRAADGHQSRISGTTTTLSSSNTPGHSNFIKASSSPYDWRSPQNTNLWQGVNGVNNPCPTAYRIPTEAELNAERLSWSSNNAAGAFASPLKLPVAGYRDCSLGSLHNVGSYGRYWSSTLNGAYSRKLYFDSSDANMNYYSRRAYGYSVRCLKD